MTNVYSPWGPQPLNDNRPPLMIGLTGLRNVGKSTVAKMLVEEHGFEGVHPYEGGKVAAAAFFEYVTGDFETAQKMVYGDLKDVPSPHLPDGVSPRFFMEKDGHFRGATLGLAWTLGLEISIARRRAPRAPIVVESIVYEADWFKAQGGLVVRLERPGHLGPAGVESDGVQALVAADATISATTVGELRAKARAVVEGLAGGLPIDRFAQAG